MDYKEGMTYEEFIAQIHKRGKGRYNADYGVKDYIKHYKHTVWRYQGGKTQVGKRRKRMNKNGKWTITPSTYRKIITSINSLLLEAILQGEDIRLPLGFGILYGRQKEVYTKLDADGSLKTNRAVDWDKTRKLWFEDKESRDTKQVVYQDNCTVKPYLRIQFGDFTNKRFLSFMPMQGFIRNTAKKIQKGEVILPPRGASVKAIKDI